MHPTRAFWDQGPFTRWLIVPYPQLGIDRAMLALARRLKRGADWSMARVEWDRAPSRWLDRLECVFSIERELVQPSRWDHRAGERRRQICRRINGWRYQRARQLLDELVRTIRVPDRFER